MGNHSPEIFATIQRVKEELEKLREEHSVESDRAVYVGMTREQAEKRDTRRERIVRLSEQLAVLEKSAT